MTNRILSKAALRLAAKTLAFGVIMGVGTPAPLSALDGQILSGGGHMVLPGRYYSAPGHGELWFTRISNPVSDPNRRPR